MKINITHIFKNLDGTVVEDDKKKPFSLKEACCNSLLATYTDERNLDMAEKVARYALSVRIHGAKDTIDLSAEEIVLIKKMIGKAFGPLVCGQSVNILDPKPKE